MKCLNVNLAKYVQDIYAENYKTFMKKINENLNKWRYIPRCSWIGKLNVVKMSILLKLIYGSNTIPMKIPERFFL